MSQRDLGYSSPSWPKHFLLFLLPSYACSFFFFFLMNQETWSLLKKKSVFSFCQWKVVHRKSVFRWSLIRHALWKWFCYKLDGGFYLDFMKRGNVKAGFVGTAAVSEHSRSLKHNFISFLLRLNETARKLLCRSTVTRVRLGNCGGESGPRTSVFCFPLCHPLAVWLWASCFILPYISLPFLLSKLWRAWEM